MWHQAAFHLFAKYSQAVASSAAFNGLGFLLLMPDRMGG
jgi:hypothetical protein